MKYRDLNNIIKKSYKLPFKCDFGVHIDFGLGAQNFISLLTFGAPLMNFPTWVSHHKI